MAKRIEKGICGICPANCGIGIELENDRIAKIHPWKDHPLGVPCVRGLHAPEIVYSPDRITTPLKRKGPKGSLDFEEISWDRAFDEIAKKIIGLKDKYGPQCIGSFLGRGNFEQSLFRMFSANEEGFPVPNAIFMPLGSPNTFSVASTCYISHGVIAPATTFGAPFGILQPDLEAAEVVFVWGSNPATDSPFTNRTRLQKAKNRGAKIVVIDPIKTSVAGSADLWLPIQPGTDGALIHGILCQCFEQGLIDREFGQTYCRGFSELEEYVTRFQPELVEKITRIPKEKLFEITNILTSTEKVAFLTDTGLEFSNTGVQALRALFTLWALTGHMDVAGGMRFQRPNKVPFRRPDVRFPTEIPPIGMDKYPFFCKTTKNAHFMEFPRSVLHDDPYKMRFLLIGGASVLTNFPNAGLFTKALAVLDYMVTVNLFLTEDARYADMVLPATTYFEMSSICGYPNQSPKPYAIQYRKKIIEPIGDAMNCYLIYAKLAERLGYGQLFPQSEEDMIKYVIGDLPMDFETFQKRSEDGPILTQEGPTPEFEEKKWVTGNLRPDGKPGFPTPSGKWEITSSILENLGHNPLPVYIDVVEGPENKNLTGDYPLTLTTGARIQSTFRSQHLNIPGLLKLQPTAEALIHPADAAPREITTGDKVRVRSPHGEVPYTARVTRDIIQGTVEVNMGGGSPFQAAGWRDSNANYLTDEKNRDSISGFPVYKALLCEVEKV
ncbi:MAG: molybdopterin-dependent oxidoreductase [Deltaproteobacteria bacterium]|nr:molybdopterin-dependent oxidoreductase [Deltaproteobacteria bacterium]